MFPVQKKEGISPLPDQRILITLRRAAGETIQLAYKLLPGRDEGAAISIINVHAGTSRQDGTSSLSLWLDLGSCAWACLQITRWSGQMKRSYQPITDNNGQEFAGGPLLELQTFLEQNRFWVRKNEPDAIAWLKKTCKNRGLKDICAAIEEAEEAIGQDEMDQAWQKVARALEVEIAWPSTWEGVISAPIHIAQKVQKTHHRKWKLHGPKAYHWGEGHPSFPEEKATGYCLLDAARGTIYISAPAR